MRGGGPAGQPAFKYLLLVSAPTLPIVGGPREAGQHQRVGGKENASFHAHCSVKHKGSCAEAAGEESLVSNVHRSVHFLQLRGRGER